MAFGLLGSTSLFANGGNGGDVPTSELGFGEWVFDEDTGQGMLEVTWDSEETLAGFQFDLPDVEITSAYGGLAEESGFAIYAEGDTVLAFFQSADGYIYGTKGPEVLVNLTFEIVSDRDIIEFAGVVCAAPGGVAMEVTADDSIELSGPPCVADLNGDGSVSGADLTILLSHWGPCNVFDCVGDLNGDTNVDGADLTIVLSAWGSCS